MKAIRDPFGHVDIAKLEGKAQSY